MSLRTADDWVISRLALSDTGPSAYNRNSTLVNNLVPCAWLSSGALEVLILRLRLQLECFSAFFYKKRFRNATKCGSVRPITHVFMNIIFWQFLLIFILSYMSSSH